MYSIFWLTLTFNLGPKKSFCYNQDCLWLVVVWMLDAINPTAQPRSTKFILASCSKSWYYYGTNVPPCLGANTKALGMYYSIAPHTRFVACHYGMFLLLYSGEASLIGLTPSLRHLKSSQLCNVLPLPFLLLSAAICTFCAFCTYCIIPHCVRGWAPRLQCKEHSIT